MLLERLVAEYIPVELNALYCISKLQYYDITELLSSFKSST